jgi:hypothetical protein
MFNYSRFRHSVPLCSVLQNAEMEPLRTEEIKLFVLFNVLVIWCIHKLERHLLDTHKLIWLYRISGSHSGGYEEFYILGHNAFEIQPTFRIKLLHWPWRWRRHVPTKRQITLSGRTLRILKADNKKKNISGIQNKICRWHKNRAVYCETPWFILPKDSLIQYASLFVDSVSIRIEINSFSSFSLFYLRMRKGVNLHPAIVRSETAVRKLIDRYVLSSNVAQGAL